MMSDNPYESPKADCEMVGVKSGKVEDVRAVAVYQKVIQVCILLYLLVMFASIFTPPALQQFIGLALLPVGLAGVVSVFLLSAKVYNTFLGLFLAILTLIPCLGILILLIINGKATKVLRENGYKVGLLGARLSDFDVP
jgi:hypothetical protein